MSLPYENATTGRNALGEIQSILQRFGVARFGHMDDFATGETIIEFEWKNRQVRLVASAKGYAAAYLKEHPYTSRMKVTKQEHEARALAQGKIATFSILRDWIKGQVTAVEVGMLSFESAFLPHMLLPSGESVMQRIERTDFLQIESQPNV